MHKFVHAHKDFGDTNFLVLGISSWDWLTGGTPYFKA